MQLVIVLLSTFSWSLCLLFLLLKELTAPPSLLLHVKLFSAYTISNSDFKIAAGVKAYSKLLLIIVKINIKSLEYSYVLGIFQKILHFYKKARFSPFLLCVMFYLLTSYFLSPCLLLPVKFLPILCSCQGDGSYAVFVIE